MKPDRFDNRHRIATLRFLTFALGVVESLEDSTKRMCQTDKRMVAKRVDELRSSITATLRLHFTEDNVRHMSRELADIANSHKQTERRIYTPDIVLPGEPDLNLLR